MQLPDAPIEQTHERLEVVVDRIPTMLWFPRVPSAFVADEQLPVNVNFHGSITYKDGKPNVTGPAFFDGTSKWLAGQRVYGVLAFPYGTGALGGERLGPYLSALQDEVVGRVGVAPRFDLSGHSRGGFVLGSQAMKTASLRALIDLHGSAVRFLDPVMDDDFVGNAEWLVGRGLCFGVIWGHSELYPQRPAVEKLVRRIEGMYPGELRPVPEGADPLDLAIPERGIVLLKMHEGTPWNSHQEVKAALPWLMARTWTGGALLSA